MKKAFQIIFLFSLLMTFSLVSFGQVAEPVEEVPNWITVLSGVLNAVFMVLSIFLNREKEKAKGDMIKAESKLEEITNVAKAKLDQINKLAEKINLAVADNKITSEEVKGIAQLIKDFAKF